MFILETDQKKIGERSCPKIFQQLFHKSNLHTKKVIPNVFLCQGS